MDAKRLDLLRDLSAPRPQAARRMSSARTPTHRHWMARMTPVQRVAADLEDLRIYGMKLGLTEEQSDAVIRSWSRYYLMTPWALNVAVIRGAMIRRAMGDRWDTP